MAITKAKILLITLFIFAITDTLLTYEAVFFSKVAEEFNPFVRILWDNFGVVLGELIRFSIIGSIFFLIIFKLKSNSPNARKGAIKLLWFLNILWGLVVINNIYHLFFNI